MFKKKQFLTVISIAVMSFLIGTTFNIMSFAEDSDGNPFDEIWEAIHDLEEDVKSLNETVEDLKIRKPTIMTAYKSYYKVFTDDWHDLVSMSVTISERANVLSIVTSEIYYRGETESFFRFRVNETYSEVRRISEEYILYGRIVELHHVWTNLKAGNYTFAFQCSVKEDGFYLETSNIRLTLIVIH